MLKVLLFLVLLVFLSPYGAYCAPVVQEESVEEPDAADADMADMPEKLPQETKQSAKPGHGKDKETIAPPKEKKPGEGMESGFHSVVLLGLNKVTGKSSRVEAPIGGTVRFGTLEITPRSCWKSAPEDRPENAVLLEIYETKPGEPPAKLFLGWMFSSTPALSSLEHPFYDITVLGCGKLTDGKI